MNMESENISPLAERKRKLLLVLPAFAVPFLTGFFFLLGGGKEAGASKNVPGGTGINMSLPAAQLKDNRSLSKMSFYEQADKDSASLQEKLKNDPYFGRSGANGNKAVSIPGDGSLQGIKDNILKTHPELGSAVGQQAYYPGSMAGRPADPNEQKVYDKIEQLNQALNAPATVQTRPAVYPGAGPAGESPDLHADVDRLERMLQNLKEGGSGQDPQITGWNGVLDKILAIQNPPSKDSLRQLSMKNKGKTYPVSATMDSWPDSISLLQIPDSGSHRRPINDLDEPVGFYGLDDGAGQQAAEQNVITAAIDENQTLVTGADVKMRLTSELYVGGTLITAGTPVSGIASLSGERLRVQVSSIRYQNAIYPVNLSVYDVDGVAGIYIPGSINRDVSKESADQAINSMNMMSMDPSVGAQAASAGIEAAKSLISHKIRLIRVTVKDGYQVFLKDGSN